MYNTFKTENFHSFTAPIDLQFVKLFITEHSLEIFIVIALEINSAPWQGLIAVSQINRSRLGISCVNERPFQAHKRRVNQRDIKQSHT